MEVHSRVEYLRGTKWPLRASVHYGDYGDYYHYSEYTHYSDYYHDSDYSHYVITVITPITPITVHFTVTTYITVITYIRSHYSDYIQITMTSLHSYSTFTF